LYDIEGDIIDTHFISGIGWRTEVDFYLPDGNFKHPSFVIDYASVELYWIFDDGKWRKEVY
jgi:hypothetical protein